MKTITVWRRISLPLLLGGFSTSLTVHCRNWHLPMDLVSCAEMESGDFSQFRIVGAPSLEADLKTFFDAAYTFKAIASDTETNLVASCSAIGKDIGVDKAILDLKPGGGKGEKLCDAVAAKISDILKANAGVTLSIEEGTPRCVVDVGTVITCLGGAFDPGLLKMSCQGGDIGGQCDGDCQGACSTTADAGPAGSGAAASCAGTCTGGCSLAYKSPTCSGDFVPPSAVFPEKKVLACGLKGIAATRCDVTLTIHANGDPGADVQKLVASLRANVPAILSIEMGTGPKLAAAAAGVSKAGFDVKSSFGPKIGLHGGACLLAAIAKATSAGSDIKSDLDASARINVSLGGGAMNAKKE